MTVNALRLDAADNVVSVLVAMSTGECPKMASGTVPALKVDVPMGHKVALVSIPRGDAVIKFGAVIGHATQDIAPGDHVHLHNLRGDIA